MASTPVRTRTRATNPKSRARGSSAGARKPSTTSGPASTKTDELGPLLEEGIHLAEQAIGNARFSGLWGLAPTLAGVAGRYAKREPKKAAGLVLGLGGLLLVGRALLGSSSDGASKKSGSPRKGAKGRGPTTSRARKPGAKAKVGAS